ncbi:MAG TPA: DegT/DnrJ/EryC1/StrS family aminotransferase [Bacteroidales bacterium]|nr:DegT/DnrJ/EryC1/StrS family aminotransferase [Bacteroidales bacterium]
MEKLNKPIYVTQPAMPPLEEFREYLEKIWETRVLTNHGPFHQQFESALAEYLGVKHVSVFVNGTIALITALQALRITGEVITSPFSFVATTHSLWWNNIRPVFADIDPVHFNLDPDRIEAAITPQTTAIMPVHVYGNPCRLDEIQKIADTHGLRVIYDAAHAFGVRVHGNPILNYGDMSVLSFHATKPFNTFEGGAIACRDENMKNRLYFLKNFGFANELSVIGPGINAKMNEVQAAFGLLQLKHIDDYIVKRKVIAETYRSNLARTGGIRLLDDVPGTFHSYSYFPVLIDREEFGLSRDEVYEKLKEHNVYGRRYFYPLISQFPVYRNLPSSGAENLPVATRVAEQVICLPIYPALEMGSVHYICDLIKNMER